MTDTKTGLDDLLFFGSEPSDRALKQIEQEEKDSQALKDWFDKTHDKTWKPTILVCSAYSKVEYSDYTGYPLYPFTIDD